MPFNFWIHMIGIPMALLAAPLLLIAFEWYWGVGAFVLGYLLQWIGHLAEGNDLGEWAAIKRLCGLPYVGISPRWNPVDPTRLNDMNHTRREMDALIDYVLDLCGVVLVMTVNPGFGGQQFLPEMVPKIRALRGLCDERGLDPVIEVDGGLSGENAWQVSEAGATAIVAGSHIFHAPDYARAIAAIRNSSRRP